MLEASNIYIITVALILGLIIGFISAIIALDKKYKQKGVSSLRTQRSVLGGKFSEHMAPYLPGFPNDLKPSEAKFLGDPTDFIIFKGLDEKNISEVVFVEVKTGKARLNNNESSLKKVIEEKKVRYITYTVPSEVSRID